MTLIGVAGLLNYADIYHVALRQDHVMSLLSFTATLLMLGLLLAFAGRGLLVVTIIYFGAPMLGQVAGIARLRATRRLHVRPVFTLARWRGHARETLPVAGNSFAEYLKIFGSGLLLARFASLTAYARYATIVLFVSRLANPMSLISRPLMPAFIDALHHRDEGWLRRLRLAVGGVAGATLAGALAAAAILPIGWVTWALPRALVAVTRGDIILAALFLWGLSMSSLLNPLFVARRRAGTVARVNAGGVGVGLVAGCLASARGHEGGMLAGMAVTTALSASILSLIAARNLLTLHAPDRVDPPEPEPVGRADLR